MKRLVFAGCSFTHTGDSWAYNARPWIFDHGFKPIPGYNLHTRCEHYGNDYSKSILSQQTKKFIEKYPNHSHLHDLFLDDNYWGSTLDPDEYEINVFGMGSNSNTNTARAIMHFVENYEHKIDTIVFQISGFARREMVCTDQDAIDKEIKERHGYSTISTFDDVTFVKQWGSINYEEVMQETDPSLFRKGSAKFYSTVVEPEEYHIRAIEQLQNLTNFCKVNDINLGYFHGWDNIPKSDNDPDDFTRKTDTRQYPSRYFKNKYSRYVKPLLISNKSLIELAQQDLPKELVYDIMDNGNHGGHPCPIAHKHYWNTIVRPFILSDK